MSKEDLNEILDITLSQACSKIEENKVLDPFAVVMLNDGELELTDTILEKKEEIADFAKEVGFILNKRFESGEIKAFAAACCVLMTRYESEGDITAVKVDITHKTEGAHTCYLPFKLTDDNLEFGEVFR